MIKRLIPFLFLLPLPALGQNVFNCSSGFSTTTTNPCGVSQHAGNNGVNAPFFNAHLADGTQFLSTILEIGQQHAAFNFQYESPVNVQAFTSTYTFVPSGNNLAFFVTNYSNNGAVPWNFSQGAGCEAGFYQQSPSGSTSNLVTNIFAFDLSSVNYDNITDANSSTFYSTAMWYQSGNTQDPCMPNDANPNWGSGVNKLTTSPVPLVSPSNHAPASGFQNTTTGDTYQVTVTYDGNNFTYTLFDVTAGGSCTPVTSSTCASHTWTGINIPSLVGGNTGYIGFTASSGNPTSTETIGGWTYTVNSPVSTTGLLTPQRALLNWSQAGAGTIPARSTNCNTLGTSGQVPTFPQSVTGAQIVSALAGCTAGQTVFLNTGTYTISSTMNITTNNVTLRGAGANNTILNFTGMTSNCLGIGPTGICLWNGDSGTGNFATNIINWTGGYAPGTTNITLGTAVQGSLSNLQVGSLLQLNQLDDPNSDNGQWWNCGTNPFCTWGGTSNAWVGRALTQIVTVTAISGSSITISPGLYSPKWNSAQTPYAVFSSTLPLTGFGLENLQVNTQSLGDEQAMINTVWATNSWIKNVALVNNAAPGNATATRKHIEAASSSHLTIRDSYLYGGSPSSESYGVDLMWGTSDTLVENNIAHHMASAYILETGTGNVFDYNYSADNYYTGGGGAPNWQQCDLYHHDAGDFYDLFEGNEGICAYEDDGHGTAFGLTYFRNYLSGHDPATTCPASTPNCGTQTKLQNTCAFCDQAFNRYTNFVANVIGDGSGYATTYQNQGASGSPNSCPGFTWNVLYSLNFANGNQQPFSPTCTPGFPIIDNDPIVSTSLMRWGNYDVVNKSVQTNSSETGSGASTYPGLASPSTTWANYPSFVYASKPSFFPSTITWPGNGPDVTGGNIANVGGHANHNPAANCFLNFLGGKTDGSSGPLSYDYSLCPAGGGSTTLNPPLFSPAGGPFLTLPSVVNVSGPSGATTCTTTDGSTPTATTPGTCSNGSSSSSFSSITNGEVLKSISTEAAFTNSGVATATYTQVPIKLNSHSTAATGSQSCTTLTVNLTPAAGDGLTCEATTTNAAASATVSDSVNGSYTAVGNFHSNSTIGSWTGEWYLSGASGSPVTVTLTPNASATFCGLRCQSWTPATAGTFTLDSSFSTGAGSQQDGTTSNPTTGAAGTPTNNNSLVLGNLLVNNSTPSVGSGFTLIDANGQDALTPEYQVQTTATSVSTAWINSADSWTAQRMGFFFTTTGTVATPTCTPTSGTPPQTLTCSDTTTGASIYYTTDGTTPTASSTLYSGSISVTVNPTTVKLIGIKSGSTNSGIQSYTYASTTASTPTFSPASGSSLTSGTTITISTSPSACNSSIYWSKTNPPTTNDINGSSFIFLAGSTWYAKVISCPGFSDSAVGSATYTLATTSYSLNVTTNHGTVINNSNCATGITSLVSGTQVSCTAVPATTPTPYYFTGWTGNPPVCVTGLPTCTFSMMGNVNLSPVFTPTLVQTSGTVKITGNVGVQ